MDNEQLLLAISDMMDKKFDEKLSPIHIRLDKMDARLDKMDARLDKMDARLDKMDIRLDKVESQVSALRAGQLAMGKELREINIRVSDTYQLALEAWGKSTENRNWLESKQLTV